MQFWSGTAFMKTAEALAVARMFDEAGFDGMVCSDHMIYPRELTSPYPDSPTRQADVDARDRLAGLLGADRRDGGGDQPAALLQRRLHRACASAVGGGEAGRDRLRHLGGAGVAGGRGRVDARGVRPDGPGLRHPRQATQRDDPGAACAVAGRLGVVERAALPGAGDDDRTPSAGTGADPVRWRVGCGATTRGAAMRGLGRLRLCLG